MQNFPTYGISSVPSSIIPKVMLLIEHTMSPRQIIQINTEMGMHGIILTRQQVLRVCFLSTYLWGGEGEVKDSETYITGKISSGLTRGAIETALTSGCIAFPAEPAAFSFLDFLTEALCLLPSVDFFWCQDRYKIHYHFKILQTIRQYARKLKTTKMLHVKRPPENSHLTIVHICLFDLSICSLLF